MRYSILLEWRDALCLLFLAFNERPKRFSCWHFQYFVHFLNARRFRRERLLIVFVIHGSEFRDDIVFKNFGVYY